VPPANKVNIDGLRSAAKAAKKSQYVFPRHARRQSLLRPIKNVAVSKHSNDTIGRFSFYS
jgi:hypothetical protein